MGEEIALLARLLVESYVGSTSTSAEPVPATDSAEPYYLRSVLAEITSVYADIPPELNARTR